MADSGLVIRGVDSLLKTLLRLQNTSSEEFYVQAATYVKAQILARTSQGVDADGQSFTPYSKPWSLIRKEKGLPTHPPDLFFTGSMLAAVTWKANHDRAVIFFRPSSDRDGKSNPEKAYYNQEGRRPRKFFALSESDIKALIKLYLKLLTKRVGF